MEILYFFSGICLLLFMVLATYDGFYLHLFKYGLFNHEASIFEHKTHTLRAILFPLIVWLLFLETGIISLWLGILFVIADLIVLAVDAYSEKDSRSFMGGLPRWEYILHLFANSFHFTAIVLILIIRIGVYKNEIFISANLPESMGIVATIFIAKNTIPGAIILALVHVLLIFPFWKNIWNSQRRKIKCC